VTSNPARSTALKNAAAPLAIHSPANEALAAGAQGQTQDRPQVPGFVKFNVADQDKMLAFYEKAFGAISKSKPGGGGGLHVAMVADPKGHEIELLHLP
jgi:predicted enzyme related to lactoylglutathione lyase